MRRYSGQVSDSAGGLFSMGFAILMREVRGCSELGLSDGLEVLMAGSKRVL